MADTTSNRYVTVVLNDKTLVILIVILGRRRNFWGRENLVPKWWPKKYPFSNVRNSDRKLLLSILEAYKSRESVNPSSDPRDRSPIASPKRSSHLDDDVFTSDHEDVLSQATLERIDLEFYDNDPPSFSDQNSGDILPPSNPESFFPYIPDTPVSIRRTQGKFNILSNLVAHLVSAYPLMSYLLNAEFMKRMTSKFCFSPNSIIICCFF